LSAWGIRWTQALLLALACAALALVELPYESRFFGVAAPASLVHLHTGLLLAVAMAFRDPLPLRLCLLASLAVWQFKVAHAGATSPMLVGYGVLAILATWALLRVAAWAMGWPRSGRRRQVRIEDIASFGLVGAVLLPVALAVLTVALDLMVAETALSGPELANPALQVFFAKHFGIVILSLPLLIAVTHARTPADDADGSPRALPWTVLLLGVALPVGLLALAADWLPGVQPWLAGVADYRLMIAALLILAVLYLDVRWGMPMLVLVQLLMTAGLTRHAAASSGLNEVVGLLRVSLESMILSALVLLLFLFNRDRDSALVRRERDSRAEPFTGLPNLLALRERAARSGCTELAFLVFDRTDHVAAGLGLKAEAGLMRAAATHLRGYAEAFHVGSGQLALVMTGSDTGAPWLTPWDGVLDHMHAFEFAWGPDRIRVLPYLGVAVAGPQGEAVDELILRAANAAFDARQRGETRAVAAQRRVEADPSGPRRLALNLSSHVLARLRTDNVELFVQPVVPLRAGMAGASTSGEVLCRLRDGNGELMLPGRFLAGLHADRRLVELDLAVLRALSAWLSARAGSLPAVGRIGVNVAGQSLASTGFERSLLALLETFPIPLSCLCLELTETAAISHSRRTSRLFERLRGMGCHIAIDDFGVGFQSFERLKQIPVDVIKIDGSFVRDMLRSERDRELVRASVEVARAFAAETVAEYVGDAATAQLLRELGVDWGQGYWFGHPVPIADALGLVGSVDPDRTPLSAPA
jgi:EAL domain-containing protein (putative c-di-GMP-specific phosphodiesterase class I)